MNKTCLVLDEFVERPEKFYKIKEERTKRKKKV
jgi:hypothetical protein